MMTIQPTLLLRAYAGMIRRHPVVACLVVLLMIFVVGESVYFGKLPKRAAYIAGVALGVVITDLLSLRDHHPSRSLLPVRRPRFELAVTVGCTLLSAATLTWIVLTRHTNPWPFPVALLRILLLVLFVGNVGLFLFDLIVLKYRPRDLGYRLRGLRCVLPVLVCVAGLAAISVCGFQLHGLGRWWARCLSFPIDYGGGSLWLGLLYVFLVAALPEEFLRMSWQTRLGAVLKNPAVAWFFTAWVWSALHVPSFPDKSWGTTLQGVAEMVPLGLLWGYILHRTQSMWPTVLLHATNLWGLQAI
ncbi:MAG: CPBP family intramembrane glutamic endopeptidase [Verrucomicrobiia bacterium]